MNDPTQRSLLRLKARIKAATDEFKLAIAFHEAWKPAAYDTELQAQMGHSFATQTFRVIRQALRREMLMALLRLWDRRKEAVDMSAVARVLGDKRVVALLADERVQYWKERPDAELLDVSAEHQSAFIQMFKDDEHRRGTEESKLLRDQVGEAIAAIAEYDRGGGKHPTLHYLRTLRNERLAHRQVEVSEPSNTLHQDEDIEKFYQDMQKLIVLLIQISDYNTYAIEQLGDAHRQNAILFWSSVRGEKTKGHPMFVGNAAYGV